MSFLAIFGKALLVGTLASSLWAGAAAAAVSTVNLNVRSGPGFGYAVVGKMYYGQSGHVVHDTGNWCYVQITGRDGWVKCDYLSGYGGRVFVQDYDYNYGDRYDAPRPYAVEPVVIVNERHYRTFAPCTCVR
jgi:uncharacterized protein YraI